MHHSTKFVGSFVFLMVICVIINFCKAEAEAGSASATMTVTATVLAPDDNGTRYLELSTGEISVDGSVDGDSSPWLKSCRIFDIGLTSTASSCVKIEFYRASTRVLANQIYLASGVDGFTQEWHPRIPTLYRDDEAADDTNAKLHWRITNCGSVPTTVNFNVSSRR